MCWGGSRSGPEWGSSLLAFNWHPFAASVGLGPARREAPEGAGGPRVSAGGSDAQTRKAGSRLSQSERPRGPCPTGLCEQRPRVSASKALVFSDCINRTLTSGSM